jgi:hypothetical protein
MVVSPASRKKATSDVFFHTSAHTTMFSAANGELRKAW